MARTILAIALVAMFGAAGDRHEARAQSASRELVAGARTELAVNAVDPDGDPLTYTWTATGGQILGTGPRVTFDSTGLAPGTYEATVTVSDSLCETSRTFTISVVEPARPEPESIALPCAFRPNGARVDNACKAALDDVALRLESNPTYRVVLDGHSEASERAGADARRAEAVRDYLVNERGIDANRVVIRPFGATCPAPGGAANRRVEIYLLPEGASADRIRKNCP